MLHHHSRSVGRSFDRVLTKEWEVAGSMRISNPHTAGVSQYDEDSLVTAYLKLKSFIQYKDSSLFIIIILFWSSLPKMAFEVPKKRSQLLKC